MFLYFLEITLYFIAYEENHPRHFRKFKIFQRNAHRTLWVGYLNEVELRPWFRKSLDLQITLLVGYFKNTNGLLVYSICFHQTVHNKSRLHKSVPQTENGLERGFVKHWLKPF